MAISTPATLAEADRLLTEFVARARSTHGARAARRTGGAGVAPRGSGRLAAAAHALQESLAMAAPEDCPAHAYLGPGLGPVLHRLLVQHAAHPYARNVLAALESVLKAMPGASAIKTHQNSAGKPAHRAGAGGHAPARAAADEQRNRRGAFISPTTVKNHIAHITEKLGVSGRRAAVERADELGLLRAVS